MMDVCKHRAEADQFALALSSALDRAQRETATLEEIRDTR